MSEERLIHERLIYPEEERVEEHPSPRFHLPLEDEGTVSVVFAGDALEDIRRLQKEMRGVKSVQEVIRAALEILALARQKDIIIEGGGKRWRIRREKLWE